MSENMAYIQMLDNLLAAKGCEITWFLKRIRLLQDSFKEEHRIEGESYMKQIDKAINAFVDFKQEKQNELTAGMTATENDQFYKLVRRWKGITE